MSKPLDKKLQDYIFKLSYNSLPFGSRKWDSSAKKLSEELNVRGIKLPTKIFYKYKLPGDMSPQVFQDKIALEHFCKKFYTDFVSKVFHDKSLTISEKMQITRYVWEMRRKKNRNSMEYYADEIKRNNPELADIKPTNSIVNLVYGALFGFAPAEIRYYCEVSGLRNFDEEHRQDAELEKLGIYTSYVLAPGTVHALIDALQQKRD